jgi:hypothetical protein
MDGTAFSQSSSALADQRALLGGGAAAWAPFQAPASPWPLYVVFWLLLALVSAGLVAIGVPWLAPAILLGLVTLVGIVWRPVFGLCLTFALLPVGRALGVGEVFSADRAIAILLFIGTAAHLVATRKGLRVRGGPIWTLLGLTVLGGLSFAWATMPSIALGYGFTLGQLLIWVVLINTIVIHEGSLLWPLRTYVVACLTAVLISVLMGPGVLQNERLTFATARGEAVNANTMAALYGLALFTAVYLYCRDPRRTLRWFWGPAVAILTVALVLTGSRATVAAIGVTLLVPLLLLREVLQKPALFAGVLLLLIVVGVMGYLTMEHFASGEVTYRLTSLQYAEKSFNVRFAFIESAINYVLSHPLGAGAGCFRERHGMVVHNDLFGWLSDLGFAGVALFTVFAISMLLTVRRMAVGWDKWYARSVVVFQLLVGLAGAWMFAKHYWAFMAVASIMSQLSAGQPSPALLREPPTLKSAP